MQVVTGDLFRELEFADLLLVSTCARLNGRGELIMGRGAAQQAKWYFPRLPEAFGEQIRTCRTPTRYGVLLHPVNPALTVGAFQTKNSPWRKAALDLIDHSASLLALVAGCYRRVAMNFPGIGFGGLDPEAVLPILEQHLGDCPNVRIYRPEE